AAPPAPAPAPRPAPPPPPKPDPPYVQAAKRRRRIPAWAMPVLVALPVWGFVYANTLEPPTDTEGPLAVGRAIYTGNCAVCHGATGGGGAGPALTDGDTVLTFPDFRDHAAWVVNGAAQGANPDGSYGDPDREGGPRTVAEFSGIMPAFGDLTPEELLAVVRYEREVLGGHDVEAEEPELFEASEGLIDPAEVLEGEGEGGGESESGG
ncbi:MAG: c-type cytochrome, partial [Acidimicrobiales bacterium]